MNKIIVVERDSPSPYLESHKRVSEFTVSQLIRKYQGFEGDLIEYFPLKMNEFEFDETTKYSFEQSIDRNLITLLIVDNSIELPASYQKLLQWVGFDVGVCEKDKTIYSSIFNEVLFGNIEDLIVYKDTLNDALLFPSKTLALQYVGTHDELSDQGRDVEDYEKMSIYEVWKIDSKSE